MNIIESTAAVFCVDDQVYLNKQEAIDHCRRKELNVLFDQHFDLTNRHLSSREDLVTEILLRINDGRL